MAGGEDAGGDDAGEVSVAERQLAAEGGPVQRGIATPGAGDGQHPLGDVETLDPRIAEDAEPGPGDAGAAARIEHGRAPRRQVAGEQRNADRRVPVARDRHLGVVGRGPAVIEAGDLLGRAGVVDGAEMSGMGRGHRGDMRIQEMSATAPNL